MNFFPRAVSKQDASARQHNWEGECLCGLLPPELLAGGPIASTHIRADIKTQGLQHPHPAKCVVPSLHLLPLCIPSKAWDKALTGSWGHNPSLAWGLVRWLVFPFCL